MKNKKELLFLMLAIIAGKMTGFFREVVLANYFGTSFVSDAYIVATNIPSIIFSSIGMALATSFIPIYSKIEVEHGKEQGVAFTNLVIKIILIVTVSLSVLGTIFSEQVVALFASGFTGEAHILTVQFTTVLISSMIFIGVSNIQGSYLQVNKKFNIVGYASLIPNIVVILSIFLAYYFEELSLLSWGTWLSYLSMIIYYFPYMYRSGFRVVKSSYHSLKKYLKQLFKLMGPIILSVSVNQINLLIDRALASNLEQGSIASLNYADKVKGMILGVFVMSISTVFYPKLSKYFSENDFNNFKKVSIEALEIIVWTVIPIFIYMMFFSEEIVRILFERGAFDEAATKLTEGVLFYFALGLLGYSLIEVTNRIFYSLLDTKTPMFISMIIIIINIILNLIFVQFLQAKGLALASSLAVFVGTIISFRVLSKNKINFQFIRLKTPMVASIVASLFLFGFGQLMFRHTVDSSDKGMSNLMFVMISFILWLIYLICFFVTWKMKKGRKS